MSKAKDKTGPGGRPRLRPRATKAWEVANHLRQEITRRFRRGQALPPERELARQLGVGRDTIRAAVAELEREGWLRRTPRQGNVVSRPWRQTVSTTGFYHGGGAEVLFSLKWRREVYGGASQAAFEAERLLLPLFTAHAKARGPSPTVFWSQRRGKIDSLITLSVFDADVVEQAAKLLPVVTLDWDCEVPGVSSVTFDHGICARMGVKYLLDLGHRRIGFIGPGPERPSSNNLRLAAYRHMLERNGLPCDPAWVLTVRSVPDLLAQLVERLRAVPSDRRPTALLVCDTVWPVAVALLVADVQCPRDMSLLSIGATETWQDFIEMPYETNAGELPADALRRQWHMRGEAPVQLAGLTPSLVRLPTGRMGREGIAELLDRIRTPHAKARHVRLLPKLYPGNTTGRPAPSGA